VEYTTACSELLPASLLLQGFKPDSRTKLHPTLYFGNDLNPRIRMGSGLRTSVVCSWHACDECGIVFARRPGRGGYCSQECYKAFRDRQKRQTCSDGLTYQQRHYRQHKARYRANSDAYAEKHQDVIRAYRCEWARKRYGHKPLVRIERVELSCGHCGKVLSLQPNEVHQDGKNYCNMACRDADYKARWAGDKSHRWQGGKTAEMQIIRTSADYRAWRLEVFRRDWFTCQRCGAKGGIIHAHHIKPHSLYPELRLRTENGITICRECHTRVHGQRAEIVEYPIFSEEGVEWRLIPTVALHTHPPSEMI